MSHDVFTDAINYQMMMLTEKELNENKTCRLVKYVFSFACVRVTTKNVHLINIMTMSCIINRRKYLLNTDNRNQCPIASSARCH